MSQFLGWSMTKLEDHEQCPLMAKLKHLEKICTQCWKGVLMGYEPRICDACGKKEPKPAQYVRGGKIGNAVNKFILGQAKNLTKEIRNPIAIAVIGSAHKDAAHKLGKVEEQIVFDDKWRKVKQKTKDAWLRVKLDFWSLVKKKAEVIDWKTGSIDKNTGGVNHKKDHKYDHQLSIYNTAVVSAYPEVERATAKLVFLDCGPRFDPVHAKPALDVTQRTRKVAQEAWNRRSLPILSDRVFAPRPGFYCGYCPYAKDAGGPCKFGTDSKIKKDE